MSSKKIKAIPDGYHSITPYIVVEDTTEAIDFYKRAFDAKEISSNRLKDGKVIHAQIKVGDSFIMLSDEFPMGQCKSPKSIGGTPVMLHLFTENVDKLFNQAVSSGATVVMPVMNMFWGDRYGQIKDPFGHVWSIATHKEDLSPEEIQKKGEEAFSQMQK